MIAEHLRQLPSGILEPIRARMAMYTTRELKLQPSPAAWWGVPCAFLVGGRCAVYEVRPISCRGHGVTIDPVRCADGKGIIELHERIETRDIGTELIHLAKHAAPNAPVPTGPVFALVHFQAMDHAESKRWKGGQALETLRKRREARLLKMRKEMAGIEV